ncbi:hypothetical protein KYY02_14485 [Streptomyces pimonensis]|uniref:Uncharacterized protein n=1 Tax=Streptomyces pimonensis TaxID=2860288 RepID=A0ABV4J1H5_9ACTN
MRTTPAPRSPALEWYGPDKAHGALGRRGPKLGRPTMPDLCTRRPSGAWSAAGR